MVAVVVEREGAARAGCAGQLEGREGLAALVRALRVGVARAGALRAPAHEQVVVVGGLGRAGRAVGAVAFRATAEAPLTPRVALVALVRVDVGLRQELEERRAAPVHEGRVAHDRLDEAPVHDQEGALVAAGEEGRRVRVRELAFDGLEVRVEPRRVPPDVLLRGDEPVGVGGRRAEQLQVEVLALELRGREVPPQVRLGARPIRPAGAGRGQRRVSLVAEEGHRFEAPHPGIALRLH